MANFSEELEELINRHSRENDSNTPDFILAQFMNSCLVAFESGIRSRDNWYGISPSPGLPDGPLQVPPAASTKTEVESAPTVPAPEVTPIPLPPVPELPTRLADFDNDCEDSTDDGVPF